MYAIRSYYGRKGHAHPIGVPQTWRHVVKTAAAVLLFSFFCSKESGSDDAPDRITSYNVCYTKLLRDVHGPYATLLCDDQKCTQCFACLNECKLQALKAGAGAMSLTVDRSLCVGCGSCTSVCPEDALAVKGNVIINDDFFTDKEISKTEPVVCLECGKEFGTRKSFDKVMAVLRSRNMIDKGYFES